MRVVPLLVSGENDTEMTKNYQCIGMEITGEHPFIVLSKNGERWIRETEVFDKYSLFFHLVANNLDEIKNSDANQEENRNEGEGDDTGELGLISSNLLIKSIRYPVFFINDEIGKNFRGTSTFLKIFGARQVGNLFNEHVYHTNDSFNFFGDETNDKIIFNTDVINRNEGVKSFYEKLLDFLENCDLLSYFDYATYIGQSTCMGDVNDESEVEEGEIFRWSPNVKSTIHGEIYDTAKQFIRCWYNGATGDEITKSYALDDGGNEILLCGEGVGEIDDEEKYQVADIYPAYKVIMMVYMLLALFPNFVDYYDTIESVSLDVKKNIYFKMIASYLTIAQLFNSFCAARMERDWNIAIGNEYVYFCKNVNEGADGNIFQSPMDFDGDNSLIGEITGELVINDAIKNGYTRSFLNGALCYAIREGQFDAESLETNIATVLETFIKTLGLETFPPAAHQIVINIRSIQDSSEQVISNYGQIANQDAIVKNDIDSIMRHKTATLKETYSLLHYIKEKDVEKFHGIGEKIDFHLDRIRNLQNHINQHLGGNEEEEPVSEVNSEENEKKVFDETDDEFGAILQSTIEDIQTEDELEQERLERELAERELEEEERLERERLEAIKWVEVMNLDYSIMESLDSVKAFLDSLEIEYLGFRKYKFRLVFIKCENIEIASQFISKLNGVDIEGKKISATLLNKGGMSRKEGRKKRTGRKSTKGSSNKRHARRTSTEESSDERHTRSVSSKTPTNEHRAEQPSNGSKNEEGYSCLLL